MVAQVAVNQAPTKMNVSPVAANRAVWARAYGRAVAEGLTPIRGDDGRWSVKSYTLIDFWTSGGSWRDVVCSCPAGQAAIPCKHAAAVIKVLALGRVADAAAPVAAVPASPWAGLAVADVLAMKGGEEPAPPPVAAPTAAKRFRPRPVASRRQTASPFALEQARIGRALRAAKAKARDAARASEAEIAAQLDPDCDGYTSFADFING